MLTQKQIQQLHRSIDALKTKRPKLPEQVSYNEAVDDAHSVVIAWLVDVINQESPYATKKIKSIK